MQRKNALLLLIAMLPAVLLPGCGKESSKTGAGHAFAYTLVGNPDTLDPQLAVNASAKTVLSNLFEGLLRLDADGNVTYGAAETYTVSDDGLTYHFTLRPDCYWYNATKSIEGYGEEAETAVTAMDFVFAFQRMFDPIYQSPYREEFACIKNAAAILREAQDPSMIGVYAKSDRELEIQLDTPNANFPLLLTTTAALPCSAAYFEATKGRYGLDEDSVIGNGSFAMQRWLYDPYGKYNVIQLVRNPLNHKNHKVYPTEISFFIEKTEADAENIFVNGSADCYAGTQSAWLNDTKYQAVGAYSITLGLCINPAAQYGNSEIRKAIACAIDRSSIPQKGDVQPASGILPPAVTLLNKSCRELISDALYTQFDAAKAQESLRTGLGALHLAELDEARVLAPAGMMDYTPLHDLLQSLNSTLGLHLSIEEVSEADYTERLAKGDYTIALCAVTGENYEASSVFRTLLGNAAVGCTHKEAVTALLEQAAEQKNLADCVELYRRAEEEILADNCFIPLFYKQRYLFCKSGVSDVLFNPFTGQVQFTEAKYFD